MAKHFDKPTQVIFTFDNGTNREKSAGIAYHDEIICGCCGGIFHLDEADVVIEKQLSWVDLCEEIRYSWEIEDEEKEEVEDKYTLDDLGNNWY